MNVVVRSSRNVIPLQVKDLNVPGLEEMLLGQGNSFSQAQIDEIVDGTLVASSTKGNPVTLSRSDLENILKLASKTSYAP